LIDGKKLREPSYATKDGIDSEYRARSSDEEARVEEEENASLFA
jgi:hypothetical protein